MYILSPSLLYTLVVYMYRELEDGSSWLLDNYPTTLQQALVSSGTITCQSCDHCMPVTWLSHVLLFSCVVVGKGVDWSRFGDVEGTIGHGTTEITSVLINTWERSGGWGKGGRGGGEKGEGNSVFWEKRMYIHVHALYMYECMYVYMLLFIIFSIGII